MPEQTTAWKCSYCNMTSIYKRNVVRHENKSCQKNRHCSTCGFYEEIYETVYNPSHGGDPGSADYEELIMWCHEEDGEHGDGLELFEKITNCPHHKLKQDGGEYE